ncbi:MAG TPA: MFS transporter [Terriglobia bacterium]|nr:MFS transporter [Terriglobia bacterium]
MLSFIRNDSRRVTPSPLRASLACRAIFLTNGFTLSAWVPLVPLAKQRLMLNDAGLGLILLSLGAGALVSMPLAGAIIARTGSRPVIISASMVFFAMLPLLASLTSVPLLAVCLLIFGAANGLMDISMNAQGVAVEHLAGKPIFSSLHGMFSIGGILGATFCGGLLHLGLTPLVAASLIAGLMALIVLGQLTGLLHGGEGKGERKHFNRPTGLVALLGLLAFAAAMTEGAMMDWSAVFLRFSRNFDEASAGLGFAAFSATMAIGRLTGDWVVGRLGAALTIRIGSMIAAAGLCLVTMADPAPLVLAGFAVTGIGLANIVPQLFGMAGKLPGFSPGVAISAVATLAYAGILAGPPLIGPLATLTSLPISLSMLAAAMVLVGLGAGLARSRG